MTIDWVAFTPWSALAGGLIIGLSVSLLLLLNGRIAGISGLLGSLLQTGNPSRLENGLFVLGLLLAPLLWWLLAGERPAVELAAGPVAVIVAGLLVGIGTTLGSGCTSGHGICGLSRLSLRGLVATLSFMLAGFVTVFVVRHLLGA